MASQCLRLAVQSYTSGFVSTHSACSASSTTSCNVRVNQASLFFRGQRLRSQQLFDPTLFSSSRTPAQCVSSTFGNSSNQEVDKNGVQRQQSSLMSNILAKAPEPLRVYPWVKVGRLFLNRLLYHFWIVGKWSAVPVLAVSMLSEVTYTLLQEKLLIIPAAMIAGIAFAGLMKETALELSPGIDRALERFFFSFAYGKPMYAFKRSFLGVLAVPFVEMFLGLKEELPWHLVALGLLFAALKYIGPYLPTWGRVTVPHFANGGLWQVIKLVNDWRKENSERRTVEES